MTRKTIKKQSEKTKTKKKRDKCNTFCKKRVEKARKQSIKMAHKLQKIYKMKKNNSTKEEQKDNEELIKILQKDIAYVKTDKYKNEEINNCNKTYCNVGCKNTILEPGNPNKLPAQLEKEYSKNKVGKKFIKELRKDIFGKETNILDEDSFYKNVKFYKNASKKKLLKEGAVSGCSSFLN